MNTYLCNYNLSINLQHNNQKKNYFLSIKDNNTNILKEMYLSFSELNIIRTAIMFNNGIINLLGNKKEIYNLYKKGLISISDNKPEIVKVSNLMIKILLLKIAQSQDILLLLNNTINDNGMTA